MTKSWKNTELIWGIAVILLGAAAMIFPAFLSNFLSLIIGISIFVFGVAEILNSTVKDQYAIFPMAKLIAGVTFVVIGLIFVTRPGTPIAIFTTVFGIWTIASGLIKLNRAMAARQACASYAWLLVQSVINIAFGLFMIINPWRATLLWVCALGAYLVYLGIAFLYSVFTEKGESL